MSEQLMTKVVAIETENEDTQKDKYLTFSVAQEDYGIEIRHVIEIIGIQKITKVPDLPNYIKGVINLRGKIIPVMEIRARFGLPAREYDERTCVIVVDVEGRTMGVVVDHVNEVVNIPPEDVEPAPAATSQKSGRFVCGIGKIRNDVKILQDLQALVVQ